MDKVSIIIPSYGSNTNPCRAIDSVFRQSYSNVEVIVVDDNGQGTPQQKKNMQDFKKYDGNIRFRYIVHKVNKGGSAARNTGAKVAIGVYLCFLDDDDFFSDPDKIKKQIKVSDALDDTWAGTYSSLHKFLGDKPIREITAKYSGNIVEYFINGKTSIGTAAPIIKKSCFDAIGGFDESFVRHQDWEFFARLADKFKLMAVPEAYYDRCYKPDVAKRSIESRIDYIEKYTKKMRQEIKSIPYKKLDRMMKKKYIPIVFALLRQKRFSETGKIIKENHFGLIQYVSIIGSVLSYVFHRIFYGTHF